MRKPRLVSLVLSARIEKASILAVNAVTKNRTISNLTKPRSSGLDDAAGAS